MSKYKKVKGHTGIRKDLTNGKYLATKYLNGKSYSKKFDNLRKAINWRACFHPSAASKQVERKVELPGLQVTTNHSFKLNGEDLGYRFRDVWQLYRENYLPTLEKSTQWRRLAKEFFYLPLMDFKMVEITANLLDRVVAEHKAEAIRSSKQRYSFNEELKCLRSLLNWYRENYDPMFVCPILKRHKTAGIIKKAKIKNKKLKPEELIAFFKELPPFWRDFAEAQFYLGARVSEVAGLQVECVDFNESQICIKYAAVWSYKSKEFDYLKDTPKNGEISYASMNNTLREIMERRLPEAQNGFVFHQDGKPLRYRQIQYQYNRALKKAGLSDKYSSTHIMRHSMGTITRRVTGSVDMAQAVTRHKDVRVAQQYAAMPTEANRKAVNDVNTYLDQLESSKDLSKRKLRLVE